MPPTDPSTPPPFLSVLMFRYGRAPSELLAKKLAMVGAAALVAAHPGPRPAERGPRRAGGGHPSSFAGPLLASAVRRVAEAGAGRSAVLLLGRLAVCTLLVTAGLAQASRARGLGCGGGAWAD